MARLPAAQENTGIAAMFVPTTSYYLGLCSGDPGTTGANEITAGSYSYARQVIQFGSASSGSEASTDAQTYTNMPAESTLGYFLLNTASTSGTYLGGGQLGSSLNVPAAATVSFAIAAVTVALS